MFPTSQILDILRKKKEAEELPVLPRYEDLPLTDSTEFASPPPPPEISNPYTEATNRYNMERITDEIARYASPSAVNNQHRTVFAQPPRSQVSRPNSSSPLQTAPATIPSAPDQSTLGRTPTQTQQAFTQVDKLPIPVTRPFTPTPQSDPISPQVPASNPSPNAPPLETDLYAAFNAPKNTFLTTPKAEGLPSLPSYEQSFPQRTSTDPVKLGRNLLGNPNFNLVNNSIGDQSVASIPREDTNVQLTDDIPEESEILANRRQQQNDSRMASQYTGQYSQAKGIPLASSLRGRLYDKPIEKIYDPARRITPEDLAKHFANQLGFNDNDSAEYFRRYGKLPGQNELVSPFRPGEAITQEDIDQYRSMAGYNGVIKFGLAPEAQAHYDDFLGRLREKERLPVEGSPITDTLATLATLPGAVLNAPVELAYSALKGKTPFVTSAKDFTNTVTGGIKGLTLGNVNIGEIPTELTPEQRNWYANHPIREAINNILTPYNIGETEGGIIPFMVAGEIVGPKLLDVAGKLTMGSELTKLGLTAVEAEEITKKASFVQQALQAAGRWPEEIPGSAIKSAATFGPVDVLRDPDPKGKNSFIHNLGLRAKAGLEGVALGGVTGALHGEKPGLPRQLASFVLPPSVNELSQGASFGDVAKGQLANILLSVAMHKEDPDIAAGLTDSNPASRAKAINDWVAAADEQQLYQARDIIEQGGMEGKTGTEMEYLLRAIESRIGVSQSKRLPAFTEDVGQPTEPPTPPKFETMFDKIPRPERLPLDENFEPEALDPKQTSPELKQWIELTDANDKRIAELEQRKAQLAESDPAQTASLDWQLQALRQKQAAYDTLVTPDPLASKPVSPEELTRRQLAGENSPSLPPTFVPSRGKRTDTGKIQKVPIQKVDRYADPLPGDEFELPDIVEGTDIPTQELIDQIPGARAAQKQDFEKNQALGQVIDSVLSEPPLSPTAYDRKMGINQSVPESLPEPIEPPLPDIPTSEAITPEVNSIDANQLLDTLATWFGGGELNDKNRLYALSGSYTPGFFEGHGASSEQFNALVDSGVLQRTPEGNYSLNKELYPDIIRRHLDGKIPETAKMVAALPPAETEAVTALPAVEELPTSLPSPIEETPQDGAITIASKKLGASKEGVRKLLLGEKEGVPFRSTPEAAPYLADLTQDEYIKALGVANPESMENEEQLHRKAVVEEVARREAEGEDPVSDDVLDTPLKNPIPIFAKDRDGLPTGDSPIGEAKTYRKYIESENNPTIASLPEESPNNNILPKDTETPVAPSNLKVLPDSTKKYSGNDNISVNLRRLGPAVEPGTKPVASHKQANITLANGSIYQGPEVPISYTDEQAAQVAIHQYGNERIDEMAGRTTPKSPSRQFEEQAIIDQLNVMTRPFGRREVIATVEKLKDDDTIGRFQVAIRPEINNRGELSFSAYSREKASLPWEKESGKLGNTYDEAANKYVQLTQPDPTFKLKDKSIKVMVDMTAEEGSLNADALDLELLPKSPASPDASLPANPDGLPPIIEDGIKETGDKEEPPPEVKITAADRRGVPADATAATITLPDGTVHQGFQAADAPGTEKYKVKKVYVPETAANGDVSFREVKNVPKVSITPRTEGENVSRGTSGMMNLAEGPEKPGVSMGPKGFFGAIGLGTGTLKSGSKFSGNKVAKEATMRQAFIERAKDVVGLVKNFLQAKDVNFVLKHTGGPENIVNIDLKKLGYPDDAGTKLFNHELNMKSRMTSRLDATIPENNALKQTLVDAGWDVKSIPELSERLWYAAHALSSMGADGVPTFNKMGISWDVLENSKDSDIKSIDVLLEAIDKENKDYRDAKKKDPNAPDNRKYVRPENRGGPAYEPPPPPPTPVRPPNPVGVSADAVPADITFEGRKVQGYETPEILAGTKKTAYKVAYVPITDTAGNVSYKQVRVSKNASVPIPEVKTNVSNIDPAMMRPEDFNIEQLSDGRFRIFRKFLPNEAEDTYAKAVSNKDITYAELLAKPELANPALKNVLTEVDKIRKATAEEMGITPIEGHVHHYSEDVPFFATKRALEEYKAGPRNLQTGALFAGRVPGRSITKDIFGAVLRMKQEFIKENEINNHVNNVMDLLSRKVEGGKVPEGYTLLDPEKSEFGKILARLPEDSLKKFGFDDDAIKLMRAKGYAMQANGIMFPSLTAEIMKYGLREREKSNVDKMREYSQVVDQTYALWKDMNDIKTIMMLIIPKSGTADATTSLIGMHPWRMINDLFGGMARAAHGETAPFAELRSGFNEYGRTIKRIGEQLPYSIVNAQARIPVYNKIFDFKNIGNLPAPEHLQPGALPESIFDTGNQGEGWLGRRVIPSLSKWAVVKKIGDIFGKQMEGDTTAQAIARRHSEVVTSLAGGLADELTYSTHNGVRKIFMPKDTPYTPPADWKLQSKTEKNYNTEGGKQAAYEDYYKNLPDEAKAKARRDAGLWSFGRDHENPTLSKFTQSLLVKSFVSDFPSWVVKTMSLMNGFQNLLNSRNLYANSLKTDPAKVQLDPREFASDKELEDQAYEESQKYAARTVAPIQYGPNAPAGNYQNPNPITGNPVEAEAYRAVREFRKQHLDSLTKKRAEAMAARRIEIAKRNQEVKDEAFARIMSGTTITGAAFVAAAFGALALKHKNDKDKPEPGKYNQAVSMPLSSSDPNKTRALNLQSISPGPEEVGTAQLLRGDISLPEWVESRGFGTQNLDYLAYVIDGYKRDQFDGSNTGKNLAGLSERYIVPGGSAMKWAGDVLDEKKRKTTGFFDTLRNDVPLYRGGLPAEPDPETGGDKSSSGSSALPGIFEGALRSAFPDSNSSLLSPAQRDAFGRAVGRFARGVLPFDIKEFDNRDKAISTGPGATALTASTTDIQRFDRENHAYWNDDQKAELTRRLNEGYLEAQAARHAGQLGLTTGTAPNVPVRGNLPKYEEIYSGLSQENQQKAREQVANQSVDRKAIEDRIVRQFLIDTGRTSTLPPYRELRPDQVEGNARKDARRLERENEIEKRPEYQQMSPARQQRYKQMILGGGPSKARVKQP